MNIEPETAKQKAIWRFNSKGENNCNKGNNNKIDRKEKNSEVMNNEKYNSFSL